MGAGTRVPSSDERGSDHVPGAELDPYVWLTRMVAQIAVVAAGSNLKLPFGAFAALPAAVALAPLWIRALHRYVFAPAIVLLCLVAVPAGWVLADLAEVDHVIGRTAQVEAFALLLSGMAVFALVIWARTLVPTHRVVLLYGAGALAGRVVEGSTDWKFDLALPVTLMVLGLIESRRRDRLAAATVLGLGIVTALNGGRSFFGLCVLAGAVVLWQSVPRPRRGSSRGLPLVFLAALALVVYLLATALLTSGYLGTDAQLRSREQIQSSGSLIAGGRPEWAATFELFERHPGGYGAGVVPNWRDVQAGKAGLRNVKVDLQLGRQRYMFGGQFKLHSVAADLWVSYGWVGVALALVVVAGILRSLNALMAVRNATPSALLLGALAIWYLLFGPIYSNWSDVCAAAAIVLVAVAGPEGGVPGSGTLDAVPGWSRRVRF